MRALPNIIFHPSNLEEVKALKALGKAFNMNFEISKNIDTEIPEEHKNLVRERIKTAKKEDYISWEDARKQLKFKSKS